MSVMTSSDRNYWYPGHVVLASQHRPLISLMTNQKENAPFMILKWYYERSECTQSNFLRQTDVQLQEVTLGKTDSLLLFIQKNVSSKSRPKCNITSIHLTNNTTTICTPQLPLQLINLCVQSSSRSLLLLGQSQSTVNPQHRLEGLPVESSFGHFSSQLPKTVFLM